RLPVPYPVPHRAARPPGADRVRRGRPGARRRWGLPLPGGAMTVNEEAAALLAAAERGQVPAPPLTELCPDLTNDDAYEIELSNVYRRSDRVIGPKVGLTSRAMREMLGVDEPDFGHLLDDMMVNGVASAQAYLAPRVEIETAFVLRSALKGPGVTADE